MNDYVLASFEVGALVVATTAVIMAVRGVRDQLRLQTFSEYTRRYAEIFRPLPSEARNPNSRFDVSTLEPGERDLVLNVARAYFNLCSEEYFLWRKRRIDGDTWEIWSRGMADTMRLPWLRRAWRELREEYTYVDYFDEFLEQCLNRHPDRPRTAAETSAASELPA